MPGQLYQCSRCGEYGHNRRGCTTKFCSTCGQPGHYSNSPKFHPEHGDVEAWRRKMFGHGFTRVFVEDVVEDEPSRSARCCRICGQPGHYANNRAFHPEFYEQAPQDYAEQGYEHSFEDDQNYEEDDPEADYQEDDFDGFDDFPPPVNEHGHLSAYFIELLWLLDLPPEVPTADDLKKAFRDKLKRVHPDVAGGSEEETKKVIAAREAVEMILNIVNAMNVPA